jgi:hypothetical protein
VAVAVPGRQAILTDLECDWATTFAPERNAAKPDYDHERRDAGVEKTAVSRDTLEHGARRDCHERHRGGQ